MQISPFSPGLFTNFGTPLVSNYSFQSAMSPSISPAFKASGESQDPSINNTGSTKMLSNESAPNDSSFQWTPSTSHPIARQLFATHLPSNPIWKSPDSSEKATPQADYAHFLDQDRGVDLASAGQSSSPLAKDRGASLLEAAAEAFAPLPMILQKRRSPSPPRRDWNTGQDLNKIAFPRDENETPQKKGRPSIESSEAIDNPERTPLPVSPLGYKRVPSSHGRGKGDNVDSRQTVRPLFVSPSANLTKTVEVLEVSSTENTPNKNAYGVHDDANLRERTSVNTSTPQSTKTLLMSSKVEGLEEEKGIIGQKRYMTPRSLFGKSVENNMLTNSPNNSPLYWNMGNTPNSNHPLNNISSSPTGGYEAIFEAVSTCLNSLLLDLVHV